MEILKKNNYVGVMKKLKIKFDKKLEDFINKNLLITYSNGCKFTGMTKKDPKDKKKLIRKFTKAGLVVQNDQVIIPSFSNVANIQTILNENLVPVFCDVDLVTIATPIFPSLKKG